MSFTTMSQLTACIYDSNNQIPSIPMGPHHHGDLVSGPDCTRYVGAAGVRCLQHNVLFSLCSCWVLRAAGSMAAFVPDTTGTESLCVCGLHLTHTETASDSGWFHRSAPTEPQEHLPNNSRAISPVLRGGRGEVRAVKRV